VSVLFYFDFNFRKAKHLDMHIRVLAVTPYSSSFDLLLLSPNPRRSRRRQCKTERLYCYSKPSYFGHEFHGKPERKLVLRIR
jgi:hypothetical protein